MICRVQKDPAYAFLGISLDQAYTSLNPACTSPDPACT